MFRLHTFTVSDVQNQTAVVATYKGHEFTFRKSDVALGDCSFSNFTVVHPDGVKQHDNSLSYLKQLCREFVQCYDTDEATRAAVAKRRAAAIADATAAYIKGGVPAVPQGRAVEDTPAVAPTLVDANATVYTLELEVACGDVAHQEFNEYRKAKAAYDLAVEGVPSTIGVGVVRIELFSEAVGSMDKWVYQAPQTDAPALAVDTTASGVRHMAAQYHEYSAMLQVRPGVTRPWSARCRSLDSAMNRAEHFASVHGLTVVPGSVKEGV